MTRNINGFLFFSMRNCPSAFVSTACFNREDDIGTYTIKAVDDPRTLNKILHIKPPNSTLSFNELVSLWESKIGKTLEKVYVPEEQVLKDIQGQHENLRKILHTSIIKTHHQICNVVLTG